MKRKVEIGILSLGCPKNLVDSELILGKFDSKKYSIAKSVADCDVALLNTCSFIQDARQESIDRALELVELKKEGRIKAIVLLGCLPQRYPKELQKELTEIDAFVGTGGYNEIEAIVNQVIEKTNQSPEFKKHGPVTSVGLPGYMYRASERRISLTPKHFRYVKISEGCNHLCSFCSIPSYRGKYRSRPVADIVREVEKLSADGAKEIVLTAQDTSYYGHDLGGKFLLPQLLQKLNDVDGIRWVRILYSYPAHVNQELINAIASFPKVCHYLDVPLQHISDPILKSMKRGFDKNRTVRLMKLLRSCIPDIAIRTSLIVGYPGETNEQFDELIDFMKENQFERLGVFIYSPEEGTPATRLKHLVPDSVKRRRFDKAMLVQQEISKNINLKLIGREFDVLIDEKSTKEKTLIGRNYMDAPEVDGVVYIKNVSNQKLKAGDMLRVKITGALEYDLTAAPL